MTRPNRVLAAVPSSMTVLIALFALMAWIFGAWRVGTFGPDYVPMAPVTAFLLALLGVAHLVRYSQREHRAGAVFETVCAAFVLGVAMLEIARVWLDFGLPWDSWLQTSQTHLGAIPLGRMAALTALAFFLSSASVVSAAGPAIVRKWLSIPLALAALMTGLVVAAGYATGVPFNYRGESVPMALLTAIAFALLNTGLLATNRQLLASVDRLSQNTAVATGGGPGGTFREWLVGSTVVVFALVIIAGLIFIRNEQEAARNSVWRELDSVVSLKAEQLGVWRAERLAEGRFLRHTPAVAADIARFLSRPDDAESVDEVRGWLEPIRGGERYESVMVLDAHLKVRLAIPEQAPGITTAEHAMLTAAMAAGEATITDLHSGPSTHGVHMSVLVPVFGTAEARAEGAQAIGLVVLMLDASRSIFPAIQQWPVPSDTAEIVLMQRDGEEVVFLNKSGGHPGASESLRRPISDLSLPGAMVARGQTGVSEGRDYSDVPVLFTSRAVPGSQWFLIAKIDLAEVYAPLRRQAVRTGLLLALLLLAIGLVVAYVSRRQQTLQLKRALVAERERAVISERLALVMRHANDIILLLDERGRVIEANDRAIAAYGYTMEELRALPPGGLRPKSTADGLDPQLGSLLSNAGGQFETVHRRKDGSEFPVDVSGRVVEMGGHRLALGIYRDISERKAHEQQLRRLNRLYAALSQVNQAIVFAADRDALQAEICRVLVKSGGFTMAWIGWLDSETAEVEPGGSFGDTAGYLRSVRVFADTRSEGLGPAGTAVREGRTDVCNDIASDPRMAPWRELAARAGFRSAIGLPVRRSSGATGVLVVYSSEPGSFDTGEIKLLEEAALNVAYGLDSLERDEQSHQAAAALGASEARFRAMFENSLDGFMFTSPEGRVLSANPAACRIFGRTEEEITKAERKDLIVMDDPRLATLLEERERTGRAQGELTVVRGDGTRFEAEISSVVFDTSEGRRTTMFIRDITEKKKLEEQFLRAQRLESIGMLAAGIAHDLNNILSPILMGVPMLRERVSDARDLQLLDTLEKSGERGAGLVKQILGFVHGIGGEPRLVQVKHLMRDMANIAKETFPKSIRLEVDVPSDLWPVMANPTQIHQVLLNLCVNARDAMPDGGTLRLGAGNCVLDEAAARELGDGQWGTRASAGLWTLIQVSDTGSGMPPEVVARIWDPFFTTKAPDKGTGLGLPTVRGIVETHDGFITVKSDPGRGTEFCVYLPAAVSTVEVNPSSKTPVSEHGRGELILVVDDEELIRRTAIAILKRANYRVLEAQDGLEATAVFSSRSSEIKLVLTDLDMPNLNGAALARGVRATSPTTKIIVMSGLAGGSAAILSEVEQIADAFIAKPFDIEILQKTVDSLLRPPAN